jgi:hypothetical protein
MRLALQKHVLVGPPAPQQLQGVAPATGLDERVVGLVIGFVVAACVGLIAACQGIVSTISAEPARHLRSVFRPARAVRAARRAWRSGSGVRTSPAIAPTSATADSASVRHAACTAKGRVPRRVRSQ